MLKNRLCYGLLLLCTSAFFIFFNGYLSLYVFVLSLLFPVVAFLVSLPGMLGARLSLEIGSKSGEKKALREQVRGARKGESLPLRLRVWNTTPLCSGRMRARLTVKNTLTGQQAVERFTFTAGPQPQVLEHQLSSPTCGQVICHLEKLWVCDYLGLFSLLLFPAVVSGKPRLFFGQLFWGWNWRFRKATSPTTKENATLRKSPGMTLRNCLLCGITGKGTGFPGSTGNFPKNWDGLW